MEQSAQPLNTLLACVFVCIPACRTGSFPKVMKTQPCGFMELPASGMGGIFGPACLLFDGWCSYQWNSEQTDASVLRRRLMSTRQAWRALLFLQNSPALFLVAPTQPETLRYTNKQTLTSTDGWWHIGVASGRTLWPSFSSSHLITQTAAEQTLTGLN